MPIFDESGKAWTVGEKIAAGGEGVVHRVVEAPNFCVKIYHTIPLTTAKQDKLRALRSLPSAIRGHAALPVSLGFTREGDSNAHAAFMPFVGGHNIHELYNPQGRQVHFGDATFEFLIAAARNLAVAFENLHAHGVVVGDVNEQNIKVLPDGRLNFIDCDSFQISHNGRVFTSDLGTPIWTPPELQGISMQGLMRTQNHDLFGLAQLIFLLLFAGRYPFAGRPVGNTQLSPDEAIKRHAFAFDPTPPVRLLEPPPGAPPLESLPPAICLLFLRAFRAASASARPTASEWVEELRNLASSLKRCSALPAHIYWSGALQCPWCKVLRTAHIDLFQGIPSPSPPQVGLPTSQDGLDLADALSDLRLEARQLSAPPQAVLSAAVANALPAGQKPGGWLGNLQLFGMRERFVAKQIAEIQSQLKIAEDRLNWLRSQAFVLFSRYEAEAKQLLEDAPDLVEALRNKSGVNVRALEKLHALKREQALQTHLRNYKIAEASIRGIGNSRKATLAAHGVVTAADVHQARLESLPSFGEALRDRITAWRDECERSFRFPPFNRVPDAERNKWSELVQAEVARLMTRGRQITANVARLQSSYANEFAKFQNEYAQEYTNRAVFQAKIAVLRT